MLKLNIYSLGKNIFILPLNTFLQMFLLVGFHSVLLFSTLSFSLSVPLLKVVYRFV